MGPTQGKKAIGSMHPAAATFHNMGRFGPHEWNLLGH